MTDSEPKLHVNGLGEHIETREDGTQHRVNHVNSMTAKHPAILAAHHEHRAVMHERHMGLVQAKKDAQKAKGWPADKSPI